MPKSNYTVPDQLPDSVFRAYDIRGCAERYITEDLVYAVGLGFGTQAQVQEHATVVVGRDGRLTSPKLHKALCAGLLASGVHVIDVGMVPTPVLYFATVLLGTQAGIMLTASHNPKGDNGLKMVLSGKTLYGQAIQDLRARVANKQFYFGEGQYEQQAILPAYFRRIVEDVRCARPLKVVLDSANGMAGLTAPKLFRELGCSVVSLYDAVDGDFPNHHPDPSRPNNLVDLQKAVLAEKADVGFAFDGDGDRVMVVTNQGSLIWPDQLMMLFAADILPRYPGATVVFDVKSTRYLADVIEQHGGKPQLSATGHSLIKEAMLVSDSPFSGEMSGHIFFKDRWYGFDDGVYAALRFLELLSQTDEASEALYAALPKGVSTPEEFIPVSDAKKFDVMDEIIAASSSLGAACCLLDGLRVTYSDGWGLVRASNTTPCLTCRFEADDAAALRRIQRDVLGLVRSVYPDAQMDWAASVFKS
jgi:phosphomannomutase / phosphoglucomutase